MTICKAHDQNKCLHQIHWCVNMLCQRFRRVYGCLGGAWKQVQGTRYKVQGLLCECEGPRLTPSHKVSQHISFMAPPIVEYFIITSLLQS